MAELATGWRGSAELACVHHAGQTFALQAGWTVGLTEDGFVARAHDASEFEVYLSSTRLRSQKGRMARVEAALGQGRVVIEIREPSISDTAAVAAVAGLLGQVTAGD